MRRFQLEAQAASALNHPNILVVHDIGHEPAAYLVSELLEGQSLRERLREGKLAVSKAIDIARQTAAGLAAAHSKGITHRDIKPENLFLTKDGRVKILDFGLAKVTTSEKPSADNVTETQVTDPGAVLGTASYMSPEQVRAKPVDQRSDIFSLGCVLYEMLAGQAAISWRHRCGYDERDSQARSARSHFTRPHLASRARQNRPPLFGEKPRRSLSVRPGPGLRSGIAVPDFAVCAGCRSHSAGPDYAA